MKNNGDARKPTYLPTMAEPWLNPEWRPPATARATIVMVHGAVVDGYEMFLLRRRLERFGYATRLFHYRSMMRGLDHNVDRLAEFIRKTEGDIVHVVGHSMGGVLTRQVFEQAPDPRPGRLVAIASPLLNLWIGHRALEILPQLGPMLIGKTVRDHIAKPADPIWRGTRDFAVVAGTYPFGIGRVFPDLPQPSDGVVLLEETRLGGIQDHVVYRINHFGLLVSRRCAVQVARFLATGAFVRDASYF
jgi:pimeloyl-ACP methyl ester carboxylesterase